MARRRAGARVCETYGSTVFMHRNLMALCQSHPAVGARARAVAGTLAASELPGAVKRRKCTLFMHSPLSSVNSTPGMRPV